MGTSCRKCMKSFWLSVSLFPFSFLDLRTLDLFSFSVTVYFNHYLQFESVSEIPVCQFCCTAVPTSVSYSSAAANQSGSGLRQSSLPFYSVCRLVAEVSPTSLLSLASWGCFCFFFISFFEFMVVTDSLKGYAVCAMLYSIPRMNGDKIIKHNCTLVRSFSKQCFFCAQLAGT